MLKYQKKKSPSFFAFLKSSLAAFLNLSLAHEDKESPEILAESEKACFSASKSRIWSTRLFTKLSGFFGLPLFAMHLLYQKKNQKQVLFSCIVYFFALQYLCLMILMKGVLMANILKREKQVRAVFHSSCMAKTKMINPKMVSLNGLLPKFPLDNLWSAILQFYGNNIKSL